MIKECGVFNEEERLIAAFKSPQFIRLVIDNTAVFIDSEEIRMKILNLYAGKIKHQEDSIQANIVKLLRDNGYLVFAVPNGGKRSAITGAILKKTGTLAGVADLVIVLDRRVVFVEVKTLKGRQQESQKIFQEKVESLGHTYEIWRTIEDCSDFIKNEKK